jgi:cell wall-associated NlpC family hydrolase
MKLFIFSLTLLFAVGCGSVPPVVYGPKPPAPELKQADPSKTLTPIGHAIQAGAFTNPQNATRLTQALQKESLDAYYFVHKTGLYKVRFGDFASKETAAKTAETLHTKGIIDVYYIVGPEDYPAAKVRGHSEKNLREEIVTTAERFLGIPYQWGGTSPKTGFDCSGLTAAVYELNGLKLPRSSKQQWLAGNPIDRQELAKGDLVFFATAGGRKVSHVGIYVDEGRFIHSPRKGKTIRYGTLSNGYFKSRYLGARTFL